VKPTDIFLKKIQEELTPRSTMANKEKIYRKISRSPKVRTKITYCHTAQQAHLVTWPRNYP
jgi:hypothetical protein